MDASKKYSPSTNAISTRLNDGEVVLLQFERQKYYTLNSTGSFIWQRVCDGCDAADIEEALTSEFGLAPDHATKTTYAFLSKLVAAELLEVGS